MRRGVAWRVSLVETDTDKVCTLYTGTVPCSSRDIQGVAVSDRTYLGIYASKYYGVSIT